MGKIKLAEDKISLLTTKQNELLNYSYEFKATQTDLFQLKREVKTTPINKGQVNLLLRKLFRRVLIDYTSGNLVFEYIQGGRFSIKYQDIEVN